MTHAKDSRTPSSDHPDQPF